MTDEKKETKEAGEIPMFITNGVAIAPCQIKGGTEDPKEVVNGTLFEFELAGGGRMRVVIGGNLKDFRTVFEKAFTEKRCVMLDLTQKEVKA